MAKIIDVVMRLQDGVTANLAKIRQNMEKTVQTQKRMGRSVQAIGRGFTSIGTTFLPVATALAGAGTLATKSFMDFDYTMTQAGMKAGATAKEMQQMRDVASKIGADFPISAQQAAEAMDRLAAGGFNAREAMGSLPAIVTASVASGEELATTSDVITSALNIWDLKQGDIAKNASKVADTIQMAANVSKMGMQDFGIAMSYAGAPAAALGVNINNLAAAMAVMSNKGLDASTIGTSMRSIFSRLASPTKQTEAALAQLGVRVTDSKGKFLGLQNVIGQMRTAMQGMSNTQQVAIAKAIAGQEAYTGLLDLIKTSPEEYQKLQDAINGSAGSSAKAFAQMKNTLKGSLDALQGNVESLGISFGAILAPTIQQVAQGISSVVSWLNSLSPAQKAMISDIAKGIIAFTAFHLAMGKAFKIGGSMIMLYSDIQKAAMGGKIANKALQYSVQGVTKGFGMLQSFIPTLLGPMGAVVLAIAAAAYIIYRNWDTIGPFLKQVWNGIKTTFQSAYQTIQPVIAHLKGAWETFTGSISKGTGAFKLFNSLSDVLANALKGPLYAAIVAVSAVISGQLTFVIGIISTVVKTVIGILTGLIEFITGVFTGDWRTAWQGVVDVFKSIFGGISGVVDSVLGAVKSAINTVIRGMNKIHVDIPSWVPDVGGQKFGLNIPYLARGTNNWGGGMAVINEKGGEIVDLPGGTRVIPHDQSLNQAYRSGQMAGGSGYTINIVNPTINNMGDIKRVAKAVAEEIAWEMSKRAINLNRGAI